MKLNALLIGLSLVGCKEGDPAPTYVPPPPSWTPSAATPPAKPPMAKPCDAAASAKRNEWVFKASRDFDNASPSDNGFTLSGVCNDTITYKEVDDCSLAHEQRFNGDSPFLRAALTLGVESAVCVTAVNNARTTHALADIVGAK